MQGSAKRLTHGSTPALEAGTSLTSATDGYRQVDTGWNRGPRRSVFPCAKLRIFLEMEYSVARFSIAWKKEKKRNEEIVKKAAALGECG